MQWYMSSFLELTQCDLFGWLENEVYSGATVKESDLPLKLTEFQK